MHGMRERIICRRARKAAEGVKKKGLSSSSSRKEAEIIQGRIGDIQDHSRSHWRKNL